MKKRTLGKKLLRTGATVMALCTLCGASTLSSFAASSTETVSNIVYYTENGEKKGVKSIKHDDTLFYDCVNNTNTTVNSSTIKNFLTTPVTYQDENGNTGTITPLTQWANVASAVFENGGKYTCTTDYSKYYGSNFRITSNEDVNVATTLANPSSISNGSRKHDNFRSTGLCQTSSFSELRNKMCQEISDRIYRNALDWDDVLSQGDYNPDALPELADTTQRDIYYNIVTSISQTSACKYKYNSYGLAFYDFDLKIINEEGIEYNGEKSNANRNSVVKESIVNSTKNNALYDIDSSITTEISKSESISTSLTNSSGYSFSEMFGGSVEITNGLVKGVIETQLSSSQVYESATTNETTCVSSISESKAVNYTIPAHTIVDVEQSVCTDSMTVSYDTPVALTYKVAVFSMSGDVYADSAWTLCISTAGYEQSNFSTFFGSESTVEGLYAFDSLNNKVENADNNGWDASYGNNHIFYKLHDGYSDPTNTTNYSLDWDKISSTYDKLTGTTDGIMKLANKCPMLPEGTTTTTVCESINTNVLEPMPMYLPSRFRVINNEQTHYYLFTGGAFNLSTISIGAFDRFGAAYYDFLQSDGQWSVKEGSEDIVEYDPATYTVKAKGTGTATLVWTLKDGVEYTSAYDSGCVTNENATPVEISFTVREYPF